jgi:translation initiation factor IF-3
MDYGKFKFDEAQRQKESRRKGSSTGIKEMKYRPKIGKGDFDTKTRQVAKFLADGHKVKVTIMFRGREVFHPELGRKILDGIAEVVEGSAKVESEARLDGRNMVMVLAPDRRARQSQAAKAGGNGTEAAPRSEPLSTNGAASSHVATAIPAAPSATPAAPETVREVAVHETEEEKPDAKDED